MTRPTNFLKKAIKSLRGLPPVKGFPAAALALCSLFRFGSCATGSDPIYIRMGDVNGDGIVSSADVLALALGRVDRTAGSRGFTSADMNADGALTAADVFSLIRFLGGSDEITDAETVALSAAELSLPVGESAILTAEVGPEDATVKQLLWSSADESVATVENGTVTAVATGKTEIIAVSGDGHAASSCTVTVGPAAEALAFEPAEISVYEGSSPIMLTPYTVPAGIQTALVWDSSDWNVVSVDAYGGITPQSVGTAVIGASSPELGLTAVCTVHVLPAPAAESEAVNPDAEWQKQQKTGIFTNYLSLSRSLDSMLDIQCSLYNVTFTDHATPAPAVEVARYVNPANYSSGADRYQFLDLSVPNNLPVERLNAYLNGKGVLSGMGQVFSDAAKEYNVSEVYLVAHACLETGNGSSQLARGVEHDGVTVYNMFGIGAYDGNALRGGAAYAASKGWTSPEAAVRGGAAWIAQNYVHRSSARQNTLYKMRWNPLSPGYHQYATDIGWAVKQAASMAKIIGGTDCLQIFEIPVYSGTYAGYVPDVEPRTAPDYYIVPEPEEEAAEEAVSDDVEAVPEQQQPQPEPEPEQQLEPEQPERQPQSEQVQPKAEQTEPVQPVQEEQTVQPEQSFSTEPQPEAAATEYDVAVPKSEASNEASDEASDKIPAPAE